MPADAFGTGSTPGKASHAADEHRRWPGSSEGVLGPTGTVAKEPNLHDPQLEAIAQLENLRCLSLVDCQLPPGALKILMPLQKLERLQLYSCGIDDADVARLSVFLRLTDLSLAFNEVTDDGLAPLTSLSNLKVLNLARTNVTNDGLKSLSNLDDLTSLGLCYTAVDAEGIRSLTEMRNLEYVNVAQAGRVLSIDRPALEAAAADNSKLKQSSAGVRRTYLHRQPPRGASRAAVL